MLIIYEFYKNRLIKKRWHVRRYGSLLTCKKYSFWARICVNAYCNLFHFGIYDDSGVIRNKEITPISGHKTQRAHVLNDVPILAYHEHYRGHHMDGPWLTDVLFFRTSLLEELMDGMGATCILQERAKFHSPCYHIEKIIKNK